MQCRTSIFRPPSRRRRRRGFSLIELTAVLALMALLATFVTLSVRHVMVKAKQNAARSQIAAFRDVVEKYYLDTGHYPTNDQGLDIMTQSPGKSTVPLLRQVPLDPWNRPYVYLCPGRSEPYEIISLGADGREGGDGADADISSSDVSTPAAAESH
jgi:general secretion pathway protein G